MISVATELPRKKREYNVGSFMTSAVSTQKSWGMHLAGFSLVESRESAADGHQ